MAHITSLNAHEYPPEPVRLQYKKYQGISLSEIDTDPGILDLQALDPDHLPREFSIERWMTSEGLQSTYNRFVGCSQQDVRVPSRRIPVLTHKSVSGLLMIPSLLPPAVQVELLSRLFHRDLSNSEHQTNLHLHYKITYPMQKGGVKEDRDGTSPQPDSRSFFEDDPARILSPRDPTVHKPLTVQTMLNKKLRWVTLGGQYDWTAKVYPPEQPPTFPEDVANLLRAAFPKTEAEAAILNVYSPGNTLSPHRDVSEECDAGLISVSFGCDGLFLISHDDGTGCEVIRLRSGDAVYMDGTSRFAWHAVPKIVPGTCPSWLADWPCRPEDHETRSRFGAWRGWMAGKRVNLNVRQMVASAPHLR
ncbi:hypothetical protein P175DRAFT_0509188 [Aspergillus ochraceoroseus IBT 24754]|uniref:mRNA N(6)-methyladenine demethylase n=1 Tax=Aspergillus ochraceoroseus IBT 24754 TaxID=1392256 RepID=A0A2T5LWG4_9EURO|nr:uncharacterized protein P175DRAFT_0509188 [Aspergillus ochraceoroseus IBT 24754]PTU20628.1 hypothetical protein P175DRAFT_0509188 [Aspergillus ochraceoroseus IBT 24754]